MPENVICSNCGAENPHDYTFCFHCTDSRVRTRKPRTKAKAEADAASSPVVPPPPETTPGL
jgi:ribosomal protein L40E